MLFQLTLATLIIVSGIFIRLTWLNAAELIVVKAENLEIKEITEKLNDRIIFLEAGLTVLVNEFPNKIKARIDQEKLYTHIYDHNEINV